MNRYKYLDGYEFSGCALGRRTTISLFGHKWQEDDALEVRPTGIFFFYPNKPPEQQWAYREIGQTTGIHGCASFVPNGRWVFLTDDGKVYVVGGGDDDFEKPVTNKKISSFPRFDRSKAHMQSASALFERALFEIRQIGGTKLTVAWSHKVISRFKLIPDSPTSMDLTKPICMRVEGTAIYGSLTA